MPVVGGKFGVVNGVQAVRQWSINDEQNQPSYVASNTLFGTGRVKGAESWQGSFQFLGRQPPVMPAELLSFLGYISPDDDVSGAGMRYSGDALVAQIQQTWNWQGAEPLGGQVDFSGHLALAAASGAQIFDATCADVDTVVGTKIEYATATPFSVFTEWTNLAQATLTITATIHDFVNSSSYTGGKLWTGRRAGPIDWTLSVTEQDVIRSRFAKGDVVALRLYVDADDYWELFWGRVQNFTGITVDRSTGAIVQQTVNIAMDGFIATEDPCYGHITLPDDTVYWPPENAQATTTTTA